MTRNKLILLLVGLVALAFLAGFLWQYVAASAARDDLSVAQTENQRLRLETELAAAAIESCRGNFEVGRQLASDFYTGLQAGPQATSRPAAEAANAILQQRDATITLLSRSDPRACEILSRQYVRYRVATGGPERALPVGGPAAGPARDTPAPETVPVPDTPAPETAPMPATPVPDTLPQP